MTTDDTTYLTYTDDLEQPTPDEDAVIEAIVHTLHGNNEWAYKKYHHGIRDAHAKSHGILRGELTVYPNLAPELRQGLFATAATYPAIARLSSTAGALRSDQLRGIHGLGVKLIGVDGPRCLPDDGTTQDLLFVTHREFPFADAKTYQRRGMPLSWLLARLPDWGLAAASDVFSVVEKVISPVGLHLPEAVQLFIRPNYHILGQTFFTVDADTFAKFQSLLDNPLPPTDKLRRLITTKATEDVLREAAVGGGMITLGEDGLAKVKSGMTTLREINKVTFVE